MIEDGAFYRWPIESPQRHIKPHQEVISKLPDGDDFGQTVSGQGQLFDHSVGASDSSLDREITELETDSTIIAAATKQRIGKTSLNGTNEHGGDQLLLIADSEPAIQSHPVPPPPKKPRGRTSARAVARGDASRTDSIPFGER